MCGIAGCVADNRMIDKSRFANMTDIIAHRGPDDRGEYYDTGLALGHRRLAIIDISSEGHQPFFYMDYVIVYNGEIYNYIELKEELIAKGYSFKTKTDTEVLIASYAEWGEDCVNHFNGMWSFIIYDKNNKSLFCSRDRFGIKPFYYTNQQGLFLMASEIKQFFEMLDGKPKANKDALIQFVVRSHVGYSEETLFDGVYQLMPGHNLIYNLEKKDYVIKEYYNIRNVKKSKDSYDNACESFKDKFIDSVRLRLRADVPVGYCLSGGLDSTAIVSVADKIVKSQESENVQHTISSCFDDKRYDEQEYIDEVVNSTDVVSHKVFPKEEDLFSTVDKIIWHMDEPIGSTSMYAQWNVFRSARDNNIKVMLDGQGSDEQLAGYTPFYTIRFAELLKKWRFKEFKHELNCYKTMRADAEKHISSRDIIGSALGAMLIPDALSKLKKKLYFCLFGKEEPFSYSTISKAISKEKIIKPKRNSDKYISDSLKEMQSLLHYEDRNSMAFSIESRVPFLDYKLVEYAYSLPLSYKLKDGRTKAILRDSLKGIMPEKIRNRYSKLGFVTPEDQWINNHYDEFAKEYKEATEILATIFDKKRLLEWFSNNKGKIKRNDFTAWRIISAAKWVKIFDVEL